MCGICIKICIKIRFSSKKKQKKNKDNVKGIDEIIMLGFGSYFTIFYGFSILIYLGYVGGGNNGKIDTYSMWSKILYKKLSIFT